MIKNDKFFNYISLGVSTTALIFSIIALVFTINNNTLIKELIEEVNILASLEKIDLPNITEYNPRYGNATNIIIYEYMEYLCPACAYFYVNIFPEIKKKYIDTEKITYIYKNLPLPIHGEVAKTLAKYASCIYKEKGLEEYEKFKSTILYELYNIAFFSKNYTKLNMVINETIKKYEDLSYCVNNSKILDVIESDIIEAFYKYNFLGTPSFLIAIKLDTLTKEKIKNIKRFLDKLESQDFSYNMWISSDEKYLLIGFTGVMSIDFFDKLLS